MKLKFLSISIFLAYFLVSCSTSQKVLNSWVNVEELKGAKYSKIFIVAITDNQIARDVVENDLASTIEELGYAAIKSIDVLSAKFSDNNKPNNDEILNIVKENNCDLIFTVTLVDTKSETKYIPEDIDYRPYPRFTYYKGFRFYYTHWVPIVYTPGYYTTDKSFFFEGNMFDARTESILWSVQSVSYNPNSLEEFSKEYCRLLVYQAKADGLLK